LVAVAQVADDGDQTATMEELDDEPPAPAPAETTWTVRPGDSFWVIADRVLHAALGRAPSDREIVPYWTSLITLNRSALVHPADPDLVLPGQLFRLPAPPPRPA